MRGAIQGFIFCCLLCTSVETLAQTSTSTNTSTGAGTTINIPCLGSDGSVKNASGGSVCPAILQKCSVIRDAIKKGLADQLSQKITAYYKQQNISQSAKDVGVKGTQGAMGSSPTNAPVCSVVGQKVQTSTNPPKDSEISSQILGAQASCGTKPHFRMSRWGENLDPKVHLDMKFDNSHGTQWMAYMNAAYIFAIKAAAHDVVSAIKPDLSNIGDNISSADSAVVATALKTLSDAIAGLNAASQASCTSATDVVNKCLNGGMAVTDPAQRLCNLVQAELLINSGTVGNLLVAGVITKAQSIYDQKVSPIVSDSAGDTDMNALSGMCGGFALNHKHIEPVVGLLSPITVLQGWYEPDGHTMYKMYSNRIAAAVTGSCMTDGKTMGTLDESGDNEVLDGGGGHKAYRAEFASDAKGANPSVNPTACIFSSNAGPTQSCSVYSPYYGFAGVIEKKIRVDICRQKTSTNDANVCDKLEDSDGDSSPNITASYVATDTSTGN